jgi:fibronectin type 3 domain-containing protein
MKKKFSSLIAAVVMVVVSAFCVVALDEVVENNTDTTAVTQFDETTTATSAEETTTEESTTEENTYCSEADHKYRYTTCDYATLEKDGKSAMVCIVCGHSKNETTIYRVAEIYLEEKGNRLENNTIEYDGKHHSLNVKILDSTGYELEEYLNYMVSGTTGASKTGTYKIKVNASASNNSQYIFQKTLTYTIVDPVISQPASFIATSTKNGVKLTWEKVDDISGYEIYKKDSADAEWKKLTTLTETEYLDKAAVYNTEYFYMVKAYKYVGSKTLYSSGENSVNLKAEYVLTPTNIKFEFTADGVKVSWKKVEGTTKYLVYRSESKNGTYSKIGTGKAPTVNFTDKKATLGKTYYYKIKAYTNSKASDFSAVKSIKSNLPAPTMNKKVTATTKDFTITWNKLDRADGYFIYKTDGKTYTKIAEIKDKNTTSYTYKSKKQVGIAVTAYYKNSSGKKIKSDYSKAIYAKALAKPEITLEAFGRYKEISVVSGVETNSYQVYYKVGKNGKWKLLEKGNHNFGVRKSLVASHEVEINKNYYYRLRPMDVKSGYTIYGPYSDEKQLILGYISGITVTLPNKTQSGTTSFSVTIKNGAKKSIRMHDKGYIYNENFSISGKVQAFIYDGKTFPDHLDISVGKKESASFTFMDLIFTEDGVRHYSYNKNSNVVIYFRYDGLEYASVYNYNKGQVFK